MGADRMECRRDPAAGQRLETNDAPGTTATTARSACRTCRRTIPAASRFWRRRRWPACRPSAFNRGETVHNGAGWFQINVGRGRHPDVDARMRTCIRSWTPARTSRCAPTAGSSEILFDDAECATGVRYQRPDLTGYDTVSARREVIVTAGVHRHAKVVDAVRNRARRAPAGDRHPGPGRLAGRRVQPRRPRRGPGVLGGVAADGDDVDAVVGDRAVHHGRRGHRRSPT